jgi:hypothetical protein
VGATPTCACFVEARVELFSLSFESNVPTWYSSSLLCTCGGAARDCASGGWAELLDPDTTTLSALTIVVSLMHFWYDGFVWSVRKREE